MADFNDYKGVWVFCEQRQGKLMSTDFELVSEARKLADELGVNLCGLLLGDNVEGIAKELGGYGADVVTVEPIPAGHPLLTAPRCILTPHIAWAPKETRIRLHRLAAENLRAYLAGHPINVVNP